jgi:Flp pilus assembly protein TadG
MLLSGQAQRGQTLPVWTLGIAAMLALLFFIVNYSNMIRWQIRAQNAADSAASAGIATDANMDNQADMMIYAEAVDEMRMRYLLQAMLNTVYVPSSCAPACNAALAKLEAAYNAASASYATLAQDLKVGNNLSEGGLKNSPDKAIAAVQSDCTILDCSFTYTTSLDPTNEIVNVVACKNVTTLVPAILGLAAGNTFTAVGRSASTLTEVPEVFHPGGVNPQTGLPYQPTETPTGTGASAAMAVDFSGLTLNMTWFVAGPAKPAATTGTYGCS